MIDVINEHIIPVLDVRKMIPVSVPTLRRWTASGKLETVRAGTKVLTSKEAVGRMLNQGQQAEQAPTVAVAPRPRKQTESSEQVHNELINMLGDLD